jgi:ankyrin repeat protein
MMDHFPSLDLLAKDTIEGNTPLHIACRNQNFEIATKIF